MFKCVPISKYPPLPRPSNFCEKSALYTIINASFAAPIFQAIMAEALAFPIAAYSPRGLANNKFWYGTYAAQRLLMGLFDDIAKYRHPCRASSI